MRDAIRDVVINFAMLFGMATVGIISAIWSS